MVMEKRQQHATRSGISAVTICRRSICIILLVGIGCPVGYYASIGWTLYRARVPKSVYWQPWKCAEETSLSIPIYRGVKNLEWLRFFPQLRKLSLYASQDFRRCLDDVDGLRYCSKLEDLSFSDTEIRNLPDGLLMLPPLPSLKILTLTDFWFIYRRSPACDCGQSQTGIDRQPFVHAQDHPDTAATALDQHRERWRW